MPLSLAHCSNSVGNKIKNANRKQPKALFSRFSARRDHCNLILKASDEILSVRNKDGFDAC
jgi:hypothetical protein